MANGILFDLHHEIIFLVICLKSTRKLLQERDLLLFRVIYLIITYENANFNLRKRRKSILIPLFLKLTNILTLSTDRNILFFYMYFNNKVTQKRIIKVTHKRNYTLHALQVLNTCIMSANRITILYIS